MSILGRRLTEVILGRVHSFSFQFHDFGPMFFPLMDRGIGFYEG